MVFGWNIPETRFSHSLTPRSVNSHSSTARALPTAVTAVGALLWAVACSGPQIPKTPEKSGASSSSEGSVAAASEKVEVPEPLATAPARTCPQASNYRYEYISLPPEFAPSLPKGSEELLFHPSMFKPGEEGYWSYVFSLSFSESYPADQASLALLFDQYFKGLIGAVGKSKGETYDLDLVETNLNPGKIPGEFNGTATVFDAFASSKKLKLNLLLRATDKCVSATASPFPANHEIWKELALANACLPSCPSP